MKNKIIFLDIDGVLNSHRTIYAYGSVPHTTRNGGINKLDHVAISLIREICKTGNIDIVLSSTWRKHNDWHFYAKDMSLPIVDRTPNSSTGHRGTEIKQWLNTYPNVIQYAIIDDDKDMLDCQLPYFINTSYEEGFLYKHALELCNIFKIDINKLHRGYNV